MPWLKIPDRRRTIRKLGIEVAESTVAKNMVRKRGPASPTWTAFLRTHLREMTSVDFFVVPTVGNQFLVLSNEQRRVLQFNVTTNPTAEWTGQALAEPRTWSN